MRKISKKKIFIIVLAAIITAVLAGYISAKTYYNKKVHREFTAVDNSGKDFSYSDRINIMILGMEDTRTDMIMVATFDPKTKKLDIISIPRDTYIENNYPPVYKKINSVYGYPKMSGGVERLANHVSEILSLPIHEYAEIQYDAVFKLADAVGGVDVEIPFDMDYDDPWSKPFPLHIHFKKGMAHLDGNNAVQYLRWRHNNDNSHGEEGDEGRVHRQQEFMKKVITKALEEKKIPQIAEVILKNVKTSIDFDEAMNLAKIASGMSPSDVHFYQEIGLPAEMYNLWYFIADKDATQKLVQKIIDSEYISSEDINPSKEFESYVNTIDESPFNPNRNNVRHKYYSNGNNDIYGSSESYLPQKRQRKKIQDTEIKKEDEEEENSEDILNENEDENSSKEEQSKDSDDKQQKDDLEKSENEIPDKKTDEDKTSNSETKSPKDKSDENNKKDEISKDEKINDKSEKDTVDIKSEKKINDKPVEKPQKPEKPQIQETKKVEKPQIQETDKAEKPQKPEVSKTNPPEKPVETQQVQN